ncbi:hypothetical protein [Flavobacterium sp. 3HN19-14]|uniref:hypothetical protein n=1 Tax=Flavobacterium sp. 3HN19-14 TaxID=3448133 RepID=UPI003EDEB675
MNLGLSFSIAIVPTSMPSVAFCTNDGGIKVEGAVAQEMIMEQANKIKIAFFMFSFESYD